MLATRTGRHLPGNCGALAFDCGRTPCSSNRFYRFLWLRSGKRGEDELGGLSP
jgi:hypothetical protein